MTINRQLDADIPRILQTNPKRTKKQLIPKIQQQAEIFKAQEPGDHNAYLAAFAADNNNLAELFHVGDHLVPLPQDFLEKLGKKYLDWCLISPEALKPRIFFIAEGIDYQTLKRLLEYSPALKRYYEMGLDCIGNRRELDAYHKRASERLVMETMGLYDPDWVALAVQKAELSKPDMGKSIGNINVILDVIPSFDEKKARYEESNSDRI